MDVAIEKPERAPEADPQIGRPLDLLVFNLAMDLNHSALGFATAWVNAIARHSAHVSVITMTAGEVMVEPNVTVYSLGKERGWSEPRRLVEFYRLVGRVLRERPIDACFAHMAPLFSALAAPVMNRRGIPVLLWYAHGAVPAQMRVAHALADRCVTSVPTAFRLRSRKLHVIGQGIDTALFHPPPWTREGYESTAISIGRLSPTKRIDEMLSALAIVRGRGIPLRLELTGEALTEGDRGYERGLQHMVRSLGLAEAVHFAGAASFREVPGRYHRGSLSINLGPRSIDKAILESMASGCIPVLRNESFRELAARHGLQWLEPRPGAEGLADKLCELAALPSPRRAQLAEQLREIVVDEHSLDSLSHTITGHLRELVEHRAAAG